MTDDSAKLLFRMSHIIPRSLSQLASFSQVRKTEIVDEIISPYLPEEVEFQMTWGKVAGTINKV